MSRNIYDDITKNINSNEKIYIIAGTGAACGSGNGTRTAGKDSLRSG